MIISYWRYEEEQIEFDKVWWSIPESCVKIFLKMCPYCFPARKPPAGDKMQPLKFILTYRWASGTN
jgi:hypothetical protein